MLPGVGFFDSDVVMSVLPSPPSPVASSPLPAAHTTTIPAWIILFASFVSVLFGSNAPSAPHELLTTRIGGDTLSWLSRIHWKALVAYSTLIPMPTPRP